MKKSIFGHSAPSGVCSNALVLARKLYASLGDWSADDCNLVSSVDSGSGCRMASIAHSRRFPRKETGTYCHTRSALGGKSAAALRRGAHFVGKGQRLVGAIEEFNGHEDHFFVAKVFKVMDLELTRSVGLMAGLARLI